MCIGIPMQVLERLSSGWARVQGRGEVKRIDTALVGELAPGDWVLLTYSGTTTANGFADAAGNVTAAGSMAIGSGGNDSIDLSLLSAGYDIRGNNGNDTITGSSGADEIRGGAGADTLTGGSAADSLSGSGGSDSRIAGITPR